MVFSTYGADSIKRRHHADFRKAEGNGKDSRLAQVGHYAGFRERRMSMPFISRMTLRLVPVALMLALTAPAAAQTFTTIDVPDATITIPLDINGSGDIVGRYTSVLDGREHGFLLSKHGVFFPIDYPGSDFTVAAGINARGDIVGQFRLPTDPMRARRGFVLSAGQFTEINPPGSLFTNVLGIGPGGEAVGRYCTILPCTPESVFVHGFLYAEGDYTTIDVLGAFGTNAWKVTPQGKILGGYSDGSAEHHMFLLTRNGFTTVDVPGASIGVDNGAVNTHGEIVGFYCDSEPCTTRSADSHGFLLRVGDFTSIDVPDAAFTVAFSINNRGDIVGFYGAEDGSIHGFVLSGLK
jgi:uncharacterized membrane protein